VREFENRGLRKLFGLKREAVTAEWRNYIMRSLLNCTTQQLLFG
jgi:hypothetical protein